MSNLSLQTDYLQDSEVALATLKKIVALICHNLDDITSIKDETLLTLAIVSTRFPMLKPWLHEILEVFIHHENGNLFPGSELSVQDQIINFKSHRVLLRKGYFVAEERIKIKAELLLDQLLVAQNLQTYQVFSLFFECFRYDDSLKIVKLEELYAENRELYCQLLEEDLCLEEIIANNYNEKNQVIGNYISNKLALFSSKLSAFSDDSDFEEKFFTLGNLSLIKRNFALETAEQAEEDSDELDFVYTKTSKKNLKQLIQGVISEEPIILQGEIGCGKSSLIRELAKQTNNDKDLIILHINDQTDGKSLIGSYVCTDVPGEFIWEPGVITKAVKNGYWLVIEDIDKISLEIISMLTLLLESRLLLLPHHSQPIRAHYNFRLFGTRTIKMRNSMLNAANAVDDTVTIFSSSTILSSQRNFSHLWHYITLETLPDEEIREIIEKKYTKLPQFLLNNLFQITIPANMNAVNILNKKNGRSLTLQEILKLTHRFQSYFTESSGLINQSGYLTDKLKQQILLDIFDVLCGKIRFTDKYQQAVSDISTHIQVNENEIEYLVNLYIPEIQSSMHQIAPSVMRKMLSIGRATLICDDDQSMMATNDSIFSVNLQHDQKNQFLALEHFTFTNYSKKFLEKLAMSIQMKEPVLLVGETGCGKTTTIQELAKLLGKQLHVQNLSLSSDVNDLLGGYKPVTIRQLIYPYYEQFLRLFQQTLSTSSNKNNDYLRIVSEFFANQKWSKLLKAFEKASQSAITKLGKAITTAEEEEEDNQNSLKQLRLKLKEWEDFQLIIRRMENNLSKIENGFAFAFQKGLLYDAMEKGYWILLDEINLASSETLQILSNILDFKNKKIYTDFHENSKENQEEVGCIHVHKEFFLFAAMNPPTDVCKKELPESIRNRFTEFYVPELIDENDLKFIVKEYLKDVADAPIMEIVSVYLQCRKNAESILSDGAGLKPRYSLRSLTRSLKSALSFLNMGLRPFRRCLLEGFLLNFQSMLNEKSRILMEEFLKKSLYPEGKSRDRDYPTKSESSFTLIKPFWIKNGPFPQIDWTENNNAQNRKFVPTNNVKKHIRTIAAAIAANVSAILLQGPTSVGKTTMIQYIAAKAGYKCVRINNHEHTDIQEYLGTYVTGSDGKLIFQDGLLVEALRKGYWIILDELNLAPSDILEALNRLLDDNREILIPETGEIVKPAEGFCLFATQNPPGIYGGRKPLSLAFRNRFIEIDIPDLPSDEIEEIITQSCVIAPKFSKMLVKIMLELQKNRQNSSLLLGKYGGLTVRDLIKWGRRSPQSALDVAKEGYMLLIEKLRSDEEKHIVLKIISDVCKISLEKEIINIFNSSASKELEQAYQLLKNQSIHLVGVNGLAITSSFNRMWTLLYHALENNEPVLLIGETGCGKTMVSQLYAAFKRQQLKIINCHQSTETSDFIGGYRPVRGRELARNDLIMKLKDIFLPFIIEKVEISEEIEYFQQVFITIQQQSSNNLDEISDSLLFNCIDRISNLMKNQLLPLSYQEYLDQLLFNQQKLQSIFEWQDGPLIEAMKMGELFLIDEINLAEDAVIERINSVLEFHSEITLAEKGTSKEIEKLIAHPNFKLIATMNPSGDYGKRELSPALRSRFTEIWIPSISDPKEIQFIIEEILNFSQEINSLTEFHYQCKLSTFIANSILSFIHWINQKLSQELSGKKLLITIREILAWTSFIQQLQITTIQQAFLGFFHGAFLIILDGLGVGQHFSREFIKLIKLQSFQYLLSLIPQEYQTFIQQSAEYLVFPTRENVIHAIPTIQPNSFSFSVGTFSIPLGNQLIKKDHSYALDTPTTILNLGRILRGLQIHRPILLEGPPGIGKSSIIHNLALATGHKLIRINLSEHTELSDLLGSDLPVTTTSTTNEGTNDASTSPKFKWYDGIFLTAMKEGSWVLLDELNLAPQTVLEGLNACFDHREEVFIPEICQTISCAKTFRVFCTQNPMNEGGGRKGLPASFLSRFTRVFVESLTDSDLYEIITKVIFENQQQKQQQEQSGHNEEKISFPETNSDKHIHPSPAHKDDVPSHSLIGNDLLLQYYPIDQFQVIIKKMVTFISELEKTATTLGTNFARLGAPWEFNLRDIFRWYELMKYLIYEHHQHQQGHGQMIKKDEKDEELLQYFLSISIYLLFNLRLRTFSDRLMINSIFEKIFSFSLQFNFIHYYDSYHLKTTTTIETQKNSPIPKNFSRLLNYSIENIQNMSIINKDNLHLLQAMDYAIQLKWPVLAIGNIHCGKRQLIEILANKYAQPLHIFSIIPSLDSSELLGSFEQATIQKKLMNLSQQIEKIISFHLSKFFSLPFHQTASTVTTNFELLISISFKLKLLFQELYSLEKKILLLNNELSESSSFSKESANSLILDNSLSNSFQWIMNELWSFSTTSEINGKNPLISNISSYQSQLTSIFHELKLLFTSDGKLQDNYRGIFTWENGVVIDAVIHGHWLILDNINLATSSVLDRINSILEPNGSIILTEDGTGKEIFPHENFRIFLTMDPMYGEISRAMRNRCLELYFLKENHLSSTSSLTVLSSSSALQVTKNIQYLDVISIFFQSLQSSIAYGHPMLQWGYEMISKYLSHKQQKQQSQGHSTDIKVIVSKLENILKKMNSFLSFGFAQEEGEAGEVDEGSMEEEEQNKEMMLNQFLQTVMKRFQLQGEEKGNDLFSDENYSLLVKIRELSNLSLARQPQEMIILLFLSFLSSTSSNKDDEKDSLQDQFFAWINLIVQWSAEKSFHSPGSLYLSDASSSNSVALMLSEGNQSSSTSFTSLCSVQLEKEEDDSAKNTMILFFLQYLVIHHSSLATVDGGNGRLSTLLKHYYPTAAGSMYGPASLSLADKFQALQMVFHSMHPSSSASSSSSSPSKLQLDYYFTSGQRFLSQFYWTQQLAKHFPSSSSIIHFNASTHLPMNLFCLLSIFSRQQQQQQIYQQSHRQMKNKAYEQQHQSISSKFRFLLKVFHLLERFYSFFTTAYQQRNDSFSSSFDNQAMEQLSYLWYSIDLIYSLFFQITIQQEEEMEEIFHPMYWEYLQILIFWIDEQREVLQFFLLEKNDRNHENLKVLSHSINELFEDILYQIEKDFQESNDIQAIISSGSSSFSSFQLNKRKLNLAMLISRPPLPLTIHSRKQTHQQPEEQIEDNASSFHKKKEEEIEVLWKTIQEFHAMLMKQGYQNNHSMTTADQQRKQTSNLALFQQFEMKNGHFQENKQIHLFMDYLALYSTFYLNYSNEISSKFIKEHQLQTQQQQQQSLTSMIIKKFIPFSHFQLLIHKLKEQFASFYQISTNHYENTNNSILSFDEIIEYLNTLDIVDRETYLFSNISIKERIFYEMKKQILNNVEIFTFYSLMIQFENIRNTLSQLLIQLIQFLSTNISENCFNELFITALVNIAMKMKEFMKGYFHFTIFNPIYLREFQTLSWLFEFASSFSKYLGNIQAKQQHVNEWKDYLSLLTSVLHKSMSSLDYLSHLLRTSQSSSSSSSSSHSSSFMTSTLRLLFNRVNSDEYDDGGHHYVSQDYQDESSEGHSLMTRNSLGSSTSSTDARLSLISLLQTIDFTLLVPNANILSMKSLIRSNTLRIMAPASYLPNKSSLLLSFQSLLFYQKVKINQQNHQKLLKDQMNDNNQELLSLTWKLIQYLYEIFQGCYEYFVISTQEFISQLFNQFANHQINFTMNSLIENFFLPFHQYSLTFLQLNFPESSSSLESSSSGDFEFTSSTSSMKFLFEKFFLPIFQRLSSSSSTSSHVSLSMELDYSFILIGILRLYLILPDNLIDPTIQPFYQSTLLLRKSKELQKQILSESIINAFTATNDCFFNESFLQKTSFYSSLTDKIINYQEEIILRPKEIQLSQQQQQQQQQFAFSNEINEDQSNPSSSFMIATRYRELIISLRNMIANGPLELMNLFQFIQKLSQSSSSPSSSSSLDKNQQFLLKNQMNLILTNIQSIIDSMNKNFPSGYQDVILPIFSALENISTGMKNYYSHSSSSSSSLLSHDDSNVNEAAFSSSSMASSALIISKEEENSAEFLLFQIVKDCFEQIIFYTDERQEGEGEGVEESKESKDLSFLDRITSLILKLWKLSEKIEFFVSKDEVTIHPVMQHVLYLLYFLLIQLEHHLSSSSSSSSSYRKYSSKKGNSFYLQMKKILEIFVKYYFEYNQRKESIAKKNASIYDIRDDEELRKQQELKEEETFRQLFPNYFEELQPINDIHDTNNQENNLFLSDDQDNFHQQQQQQKQKDHIHSLKEGFSSKNSFIFPFEERILYHMINIMTRFIFFSSSASEAENTHHHQQQQKKKNMNVNYLSIFSTHQQQHANNRNNQKMNQLIHLFRSKQLATLLFFKNYQWILDYLNLQDQSSSIDNRMNQRKMKRQQNIVYESLLLFATQFNYYFPNSSYSIPSSSQQEMMITHSKKKKIGIKKNNLSSSKESSYTLERMFDKDFLYLLNPSFNSFFYPSMELPHSSLLDDTTTTIHECFSQQLIHYYSPKDFHHDYYLIELPYFIPLMNLLLNRATYLLSQFPSNEIIMKILKFIHQILYEFSINSSLGKLLISLQLLLKIIEEWEINAPKIYSFSEQIMEISSLINRWRKIELKSWNLLIRTQEISMMKLKLFQQNYFFHFYQIFLLEIPQFLKDLIFPKDLLLELILFEEKKLQSQSFYSTGTINSQWKSLIQLSPEWIFHHQSIGINYHHQEVEEEMNVEKKKKIELQRQEYKKSIDSYCTKLMNTFDSLFRSCQVGEFPILLHSLRIILLLFEKDILSYEQSFQKRKQRMKNKKHHHHHQHHQQQEQQEYFKFLLKKRIFKLSLGIWEYYSFFLPSIRRFQNLMLKPIQEKIHNEMKLGKWDSLNIYALLENSEKINRKLNKIMKEYTEEVLNFPVFNLLKKDLIKDLINEAGELIPSYTIPTLSSLFPNLNISSELNYQSISAQEYNDKEKTFLTQFIHQKHQQQDNKNKNSFFVEKIDFQQFFPQNNGDKNGINFSNLEKLSSLHKKMWKYVHQLFNFSYFSYYQEEFENEESFQRKKILQAEKEIMKMERQKQAEEGEGEKEYQMDEDIEADIIANIQKQRKQQDEEEDEERRLKELEISLQNQQTISYGLQSHYFIESFIADIFARIHALQQETATKPMKQKSIRDLLISLQEFGFSPLKSSLPSIFHEKNNQVNDILLEISEILPLIKAKNIFSSMQLPSSASSSASSSSSSSIISIQEILERGEYYYYRNISEFNQLKTQSQTLHSNDLSMKEIVHMITLSENMILMNVKLRLSIESSITEFVSFQQYQQELSNYLQSYENNHKNNNMMMISVELMNEKYQKQQQRMKLLLEDFLELKEIINMAIHAEQFVLDSSLASNPDDSSSSLSPMEQEIHSSLLKLDFSLLKINDLSSLKSFSTQLSQWMSEMIQLTTITPDGLGSNEEVAEIQYLPAVQQSSQFLSYEKKSRNLKEIQSLAARLFDATGTEEYSSLIASISTKENYLRISKTIQELHKESFDSSVISVNKEEEENGDDEIMEVDNDLPLQVEMISHQDNSSINNNNNKEFLQSVQKTIDNCLIIIQNLNGLTKQIQLYHSKESINSSITSTNSAIIGCFGETIFNLPTNENNNNNNADTSNPEEFNLCQLTSLTIYSFRCFQLLNLSSHIQSIITNLQQQTNSSSLSTEENRLKYQLLGQLITFLSIIMNSYQSLFQQLILLYKSSNKLTYIIIRIFRNLLVKGICSHPSEEGDANDNKGPGEQDYSQMKFDNPEDGTGMGEGEGEKDVSDQIENEEQLLDLKDQNKDPLDELNNNNNKPPEENKKKDKLNKEEQEKGMEMNEDFEGEMYDLEEEPEDEENDDENEEEEKEEPERDMGEANFEDIIDEKQWDSEDDDEEEKDKDDKGNEKEQKEKFEKDSKAKGKKLDEMRTAEEDEDNDHDDKNRQENDEDNEDDAMDADDDNEEGEDDDDNKNNINEDNEEDYIDKPQGVKVKENPKKKEDEEKKDGEDEENNDEADKDENGEEDDDDAQEKDDDQDAEGGDDAGSNVDSTMEFDEQNRDQNLQEDDENEANREDENQPDQDMNLPDDMKLDGEKEQEEEDDEMEVDQPEGNDDEDPLNPPMNEEEIDENPAADDDKPQKDKPMTFGVQSMDGNEQILNSMEKQENQEKPQENQSKKGPSEKDQQQQPMNEEEKESNDQQIASNDNPLDQNKTTSRQPQSQSSPEDPNQSKSSYQQPSNPFLSKGNIEKEWFRRLNITNNPLNDGIDNDDAQDEPEDIENRGQGQYEYDQNENNQDKSMEQVLGKDNSKEDNALKQPMTEQNEVNRPESDEQQQQSSSQQQQDDRHLFDETGPDDDQQQQQTSEKKRDRDQMEQNNQQQQQPPQQKRQKPNNFEENKKLEESLKNSESFNKDHPELDEDYQDEMDEQPEEEELLQEEQESLDNNKPINTNAQFNFGQNIEEDEPESMMMTTEEENQQAQDDDEEEESFKGIIYEDNEDDQALILTNELKQQFLQQWNFFKQKTELQSIQLSETLKLILEPMLLTKLQGYYRSGKKISMKKIISYISSNYRKDKIWLKRKKPNQRNYQIFLLIDNSKSMKFISDKTMEIMSLLLQTFSKLEIGSLSIGTFGEKLKILFPFPNITFAQSSASSASSEPVKSSKKKKSSSSSSSSNPTNEAWMSTGNALMLNDENTLHLLSNLTFDSNQTQLNSCLLDAIPYLLQAKELLSMSSSMMSSNNNSMILQLCFIVSDARIDSQNRIQLEKIIQKMSEEHILVILLIIDDPSCSIPSDGQQQPYKIVEVPGKIPTANNNSNSILNTKIISFNEKNQIITKSYFDDFPFPYYIIVQNIQQLPEILADALKQWFELIKLQLSSNQN